MAGGRGIAWQTGVAGLAIGAALSALAAGGALAPVHGQEPAPRMLQTPTPGGQGSAGRVIVDQNGGGGSAEVVTTEGSDYCAHLQEKLAQLEQVAQRPPAQEAVSLSAEGARLCGEGNTRGGIRRLRRALVLLMHPTEDIGTAAPSQAAAPTP